MAKDYYAQLEEREGIKRYFLSLEEIFGPDWDRKRPECDMCQFQKKGYCCPCKSFIEFLEERGLELARDRRKLEARIAELEDPDYCTLCGKQTTALYNDPDGWLCKECKEDEP